MSLAGILMLAGFALFAALMVKRLLPTLLALPLMAAWIAFMAGMPLVTYLNEVLLKGSLRLASPIALVVFGAMFARMISKTGISDAIIKKAAELAGDQPMSIAILMTAATAFVFLGMSGLGAIIMVGSIALPIMTSAGISPLNASVILLLGFNLGSAANLAALGVSIGIFGNEAAMANYLPGICVSFAGTVAFILRNVPKGKETGGTFRTILGILLRFLQGLLALPGSLLAAVRNLIGEKPAGLLHRRRGLPTAALMAPLIPLLVILIFNFAIGLGAAKDGLVDPVAAVVAGFLIASLYAALITKPGQAINLFAGSLVEGIADIAGVLFLFMGIGMLIAASMHPLASDILNPLFAGLMPSSMLGTILLFAIFAPAALYRGPLNLYGMGGGIAAILTGLGLFSPTALMGMFMAVGYLQSVADPTNSHNTWIGGFAGVDTTAIMKKILPYAWGMCLLMLAFVAIRG